MSGPPLAVVTGASSGIGAEFTQRLLDRGYRVLAVARRADRLVALEESTGGRVIAEPCDLTVDGATDAVAKRAEELGGADLLVCNAGRGLHGRFVDTERCDTLAMLQLNVLSSVDLAARIVPTMVRRGSGGVIVVASTLGFVSVPNLAAYGASKAFLLSFAEALSTELKGTGVRAMALCPGPTISEFSEVAGLDGQVEKTPRTHHHRRGGERSSAGVGCRARDNCARHDHPADDRGPGLRSPLGRTDGDGARVPLTAVCPP